MKIDFDEFQLALEGFDTLGEPARHFLDTETGQVLALCRDWEDFDDLSARIDAGLPDRFRRIEPLDSRESFRIMADFVASLPESALARRLQEAISGGKPFRRFKDVLHSDLELRDQWFEFRDDAHARYATRWLEAHGLEAELLRRRKN